MMWSEAPLGIVSPLMVRVLAAKIPNSLCLIFKSYDILKGQVRGMLLFPFSARN